jgi:hypothetical protein
MAYKFHQNHNRRCPIQKKTIHKLIVYRAYSLFAPDEGADADVGGNGPDEGPEDVSSNGTTAKVVLLYLSVQL